MTSRWALKRTLKWMVEWGTALSGAGMIYRAGSAFRTGSRILTYHRIADVPADSFTVSTRHFKAHMAHLSDHHRVISLDRMMEGLAGGDPLEPGCVAITFDDGYKESASTVREVLDMHRITATFFLVTGVLDGKTSYLPGDFLDWDEVRQMASAGFSIGSHTVNHRSLGEMSQSDATIELSESRRRITEELGRAPRALSYPYGTMRDFSPMVLSEAAKAGYSYAVTAIHGLNHPGCDPFLLRRTTLSAGDGLSTFRLIMKGCLDPWYFFDKWGYRFQRPRNSG